LFTAFRVLTTAALLPRGFLLPKGSGAFAPSPAIPATTAVGAIGLAMSAAFFAYDGWNQSAFVAAEVKDPQRNVPLSMLFGVLVVMAVYVLANAAYVHVLPFAQVQRTSTLAADVARVLFGPVGATL